MAALQVQEVQEEFSPPIEYGINEDIQSTNAELQRTREKMRAAK